MTVAAHFTAFRTRIQAHTMLANKTHTALRVNENGDPVRANYVIAYPGVPEALDDQRYTAVQDVDSTADFEWDVRVIAVDSDGLLQLTDAVLEQLVGHVLTVTGRKCTPIRLDGNRRARFDRDTDLHYIDMTFMFQSRRAA